MGATGAITGAVGNIAGGYADSEAARAQGSYAKSVANRQARLSMLQAHDVNLRASEEATKIRSKAKQTIGAQRAALAAQGIDVSSGSALDSQIETAQLAGEDVVNIKNNAWREAWGYKLQAQEAKNQGEVASLNSKQEARDSLVTGGLKAASGMADYYKDFKTDKSLSTKEVKSYGKTKQGKVDKARYAKLDKYSDRT